MPPPDVRALYLGQRFGERDLKIFLQYAGQLGLNGAVLHVKDPRGYIYWPSGNSLAAASGAVRYRTSVLERAVHTLQAAGIWTVAKLDVFADDRLARHRSDLAVSDKGTGDVWMNKNGLAWANPYENEVWSYNIDLAEELVAIGFDEIQFDYVRFPSDGDLAAAVYGRSSDGPSRPDVIAAFLEQARTRLKPLGVAISADVFGLTAWKRDDFGVGQVLEEMAPHVDVICPMLYPSHFPDGFLGWARPQDHPREIMLQSLKRLQKRTDTPVRPWVQGFWYSPDEIKEQLTAVTSSGVAGWSVWNPGATYAETYLALAVMQDVVLKEPELYPALDTLENQKVREVRGNFRVVNRTNYLQGISILSLDESRPGRRNKHATPMDMLGTLDEAIVDLVLRCRGVTFSRTAPKRTKLALLVDFLIKDTGLDPSRMRPGPICLEWKNACRFSLGSPEK